MPTSDDKAFSNWRIEEQVRYACGKTLLTNWRVFVNEQRILDVCESRRVVATHCTHAHTNNNTMYLVCGSYVALRIHFIFY